MRREVAGEGLGAVQHGHKVTVQQRQARERIHGRGVTNKNACPQLFFSTQSSALAALPWLRNAIALCKQRRKRARERLPEAARKVRHQRAQVRLARHRLVPARIGLTDGVSAHAMLLLCGRSGM